MVLTCVRTCCHHFRRNYYAGVSENSGNKPHRLSRYLLSAAKPVVHENSTISFELLRQYGFMDVLFSGFNIMLPMCTRVINKLVALIDREMEELGGQRTVFPSLGPVELLQKSGKYDPHRKEFYNLEDRRNEKWYLAPTHEEIISHWISKETITEKKLPLLLYQIGSKFRDEKRPRSGLLRSREFIMKDLYSFDADEGKAKITYDLVNESYRRVFSKLELPIFKVRADPGNIGGILSHEYHLRTNSGEDKILVCESCKEGFSEEYILTSNEKLDECISCGAKLKETLSLELGHTFILGTRYSKPFNCIYTKFEGNRSFLEMGCYGLGVSRIMAACLEAFPAKRTLTWPKIIAPYLVCLITPKAARKNELEFKL
ncbi:putative proline--tRNA ligase, mitochondrial isoform X2 [Brevipalpus obovatus]|uniref:putative proline--tRNA ligase, mitochondrial isoform X2 n=1 Tax=Brevipalpus obovatus TaxID=246614 RepID=UPI003D9E2E9D